MWIVLDAVTAALLIYSVIRGIKRGFVKTAFKLVMIVAALVIAYYGGPMLKEYVKGTEQYISITESLRNTVSESFEARLYKDAENGTQSASDVGSEKDDMLLRIIKGAGIDVNELEDAYRNGVKEGAENAAALSDELIVQPAADFVCGSLCFIAVFAAAVIALHLLIYIIDLIFRLPLLKSMNSLFGALAGAALVVVKVLVFCTVVEVLLLYVSLPKYGFVCGVEEKTLLFKKFLEINPLSFLY